MSWLYKSRDTTWEEELGFLNKEMKNWSSLKENLAGKSPDGGFALDTERGGSPRSDEDSVYETSSSVEIECGRVSASVCWQPEAG